MFAFLSSLVHSCLLCHFLIPLRVIYSSLFQSQSVVIFCYLSPSFFFLKPFYFSFYPPFTYLFILFWHFSHFSPIFYHTSLLFVLSLLSCFCLYIFYPPFLSPFDLFLINSSFSSAFWLLFRDFCAPYSSPALPLSSSLSYLSFLPSLSPSLHAACLQVSPDRSQYFRYDTVSLSCEDQLNSTGWKVKRRTEEGGIRPCSSSWGTSSSASTCIIRNIYPSDTGVYWCESEDGERSNAVNITVSGTTHNTGNWCFMPFTVKL